MRNPTVKFGSNCVAVVLPGFANPEVEFIVKVNNVADGRIVDSAPTVFSGVESVVDVRLSNVFRVKGGRWNRVVRD